MITGNMVLNSKPREDEMVTGVCENCGAECEEVPEDNSFADGFGYVTDWGTCSPCCGGAVLQGKCFVDEITSPVAKKDYTWNNKPFIMKGERYYKHIRKGYMITEDGKHEGFCYITRKKITQ